MTPLVISTPPKADTGSPANASFQASNTVGREARPQALLCFRIAKSKILELVDQVNGSVDIKKIVIRNFFSVNLIEHCLQVSVEITFLMWIFTVTKLFLAVHRTTEGRTFAGIEIIEDSRIIVRRNGKRFFFAIQRRSSSEEVAPCSINISSNGLY